MDTTHHIALSFALLSLLFASACVPAEEGREPNAQVTTGEPTTTTPEVKAPTFIESHATDYLEDRAWRRTQLEDSLWMPELPYARKRLAGYALPEGEGGWDLLPELGATVMPITRADAERGLDQVPFAGEALAPERTPSTQQEWEALGERVFWHMPMRRDVYLEWVVTRPELWEEVGLETDARGELRGVVRFEDARGKIRIGATCAMCHGADGEAGRASRSIDLGRARVLFAEYTRGDRPATRPSPYAEWGPGRVDVTDDAANDALAIPDLWGVKHLSHLNTSGAIEILNPATLAVRFETQYIVGHALEARPDRRLTWALAAFVLGLQTPTPTMTNSQNTEAGERVFGSACAGCHSPARGFSGGLIPAASLVSDPTAANSVLRGTAFYKTPSLHGISQGGPYFHDASAATLEDVLDVGHPTGAKISDEDRAHLLTYLQTL